MHRLRTLAVVMLAAAPVVFGGTPKISKDLEAVDPGAIIDVIIQFKHAPTGQYHRNVESLGGTHKTDLELVKGGLYAIPRRALEQLAQDPEVAYITPDRKHRALLNVSTAAINAPVAWNSGLDGSGIGVAVIDSGISPLNDLGGKGQNNSRIVYTQSFNGMSGADADGHGTHVAGIIGSNGSSSHGIFTGVAPNVNLINLQVLDANGNATDSAVISAIETAIQLQSQYNIRVINLSLGRSVYESYTLDPLCQAVEQAWKAGMVVVAAAGNDGRDNSQGPTATPPLRPPVTIPT
jgi:serine protease AprX